MVQVFIGLTFLACLVFSRAAGGEALAITKPDHGIIHFYEPKPERPFPIDPRDPVVAGQEAILWWGDLEPEEGRYDWSAVDAELQRWSAAGKALDLRIGTAHNSPRISPAWLFDRYHVRRIGRGQWCDFESSPTPYRIGPDAQLTHDAPQVITGTTSLAAIPGRSGKRHLLGLTQGGTLAGGVAYSFQFDALSKSGATGWVAVASASAQVTNSFPFIIPAGLRVSRSVRLALPENNDGEVWLGLDGPGDLVLDNVNSIRLQNQPKEHLTDFEHGVTDWELEPASAVVQHNAGALRGRASLLLSNNSTEFERALMNAPTRFAVRQGEGYAVWFNFKALTAATLRLRLVSASPGREVLDENTLTLKAGDTGTHHWQYPNLVWRPNCMIEIGLVGPGQVLMDDLNWKCWSERVTCFPDYFDPVFREKWERFITAFAARYATHPGVGCISVGGFGRWEEVILDDDTYGGLDAQWLARGFNQQRYLEHLIWCMDLFKRLFPQKPLRICLAYGLYKQNDPDFMYRRVAQAAVARGIGLKQNGLSEKFDAWDDNTSASYLFNRYRFTPGVSLTYETAGQISRLSAYSYGHPLSVLNRALIDGANFLFLYPSDIKGPHVHKYLRWVDEQLGRPLNTTLYCLLGDYALVTEASPSPQGYRNQWLGLREFPTDGAAPVPTVRNGQRCVATRKGAPHIVLDVDDRQQYHGMSGVVTSVRYLDEGWDQFEVNCYHQPSGIWKKLGHVQKTGSSKWKTASFLGSDWCRSRRNGGEDVHADLVINDLSDGIEHIASVALEFIPAREWQRTLLSSAEATAARSVLTNTLSREIEVPEGQPLHWVALPVWSGGLERNSFRGRVFARTPNGEVQVSDKEYYFPADKDWFEMPLVPVPACRTYRIELSDPRGQVGWYHAAGGTLAYRAWRYAERTPTQNAPIKIESPRALHQHHESIEAFAPFFGLRLNLAAGQPDAKVQVRLRRQLARRGWSDPVSDQWIRVTSGQSTPVYFEPQTAGHYQVELDSGTNQLSFAFQQRIEVLYLQRLEPPNPPHPFVAAGGLRLAKSAVALTASKAVISLTPPAKFTAQSNHLFSVQLRNNSGAPLLRVSWAYMGQLPDDTCAALIPLVQNDTEMREYHYAIGADEAWRGEVRQMQLSLEPPDLVGAAVSLGEVQLHSSSTNAASDRAPGK